MTILIVLAVLATLLSLVMGISTMATGHEIAHRSADRWMFARVGFQALAIALLLLGLYLR